MTKKCILTIDYEIFFGNKTGTVRDCMIAPTEKLASVLEKNSSKMTIFWDILHYYKLIELENRFSELKQDKLIIEEQILNLAGKGHDIQLHLHPHWLDANYENGKWNFTYARFNLHSLSNENNIEDVNTISGCVSISKKLIEDLIRKVNPDYKVTTFRAGGYLIEPFDKIKDVLLKNEIKIDSSICPGLYNNNNISPYDFRFYPSKIKYNFDLTPKLIVDNGDFIEVPVATVKLPVMINIYYKFLRRIKYPALENERKGDGIGGIGSKGQKTKGGRFISFLLSPQLSQLTTDSNFREKFNYMYKKVPDYATMILHPKLLNAHTLKILDDYVSTNKIRFNSIHDYMSLKVSID